MQASLKSVRNNKYYKYSTRFIKMRPKGAAAVAFQSRRFDL